MTGFRNDGLDSPLSPNSGLGCTWEHVEQRCEESDAVESYDRTGSEIVIEWVGGEESRHTDPQAALIEIFQMSNC